MRALHDRVFNTSHRVMDEQVASAFSYCIAGHPAQVGKRVEDARITMAFEVVSLTGAPVLLSFL